MKTDRKKQSPETKCVRLMVEEDLLGAVTYPVFRSVPFAFDSVEQMKETFLGRSDRFIYGRYGNPTVAAAERKIAVLEEAADALMFSSGMAAISAVVLGVLSNERPKLAAAGELYGGTLKMLRDVSSRFSVELTIIDTTNPEEVEHALDERTALILFETPTNPILKVMDIAEISALAHNVGALSVVDNTFATPVNQRPLSLGADLVVESATKFLGGHSDLLLGIVAGNDDLVAKCLEMRKNLGGAADPESAYMLIRSLQTLFVRVERHNRNALELARRLKKHPVVKTVHYPGLEDAPSHAIAARQMDGFGGMLAFDIGDEVDRFLENLESIRMVTSLGGVETTILVPAASSHIWLSPEERSSIGIGDGLVRLSVGIENVEDIWRELEESLNSL